MFKTFLFFFFLQLLWLTFSGVYNPLLIGLGLFSCSLVMLLYFALFRADNISKETVKISFFIYYFPWLVKEIFLSGIKTSTNVVGLKKFECSEKEIPLLQTNDLGKAIYANSVTLTPGTLTILVRDRTVLVHALCKDSMKDLQSSRMDKKIRDLEVGE